MLFTSLCMGMFADDVTGIAPAVGESCYLYNVGQGKYLAASADGFTLSENGTQFTLSAVQGISGSYRLTDGSAVVFSTSFNSPVFFGSAGEFDIWRFSNVSGTDTYNLGCLERDAFSYSQVYWSDVTASLEKTQLLSMMENSLWKLVGDVSVVDPDPENPVDPDPEYVTEVVFDENDTELVLPENMADVVNVKLYRTSLLAGKKNTFCVPFDMDYIQIVSAFGGIAQVLEYSRNVGSKLYYTNAQSIKAGKPYIIIPNKERDGDFYNITGVDASTMTTEPIDVANGDYKFVPTLSSITLSERSYCYTNGALKIFKEGSPIKGFRAYFSPLHSDAKPLSGEDEIEGVDAIDGLDFNEDSQTSIYNISGQIVRQNATTTEGLPKGVYLIHGKKFVVK